MRTAIVPGPHPRSRAYSDLVPDSVGRKSCRLANARSSRNRPSGVSRYAAYRIASFSKRFSPWTFGCMEPFTRKSASLYRLVRDADYEHRSKLSISGQTDYRARALGRSEFNATRGSGAIKQWRLKASRKVSDTEWESRSPEK